MAQESVAVRLAKAREEKYLHLGRIFDQLLVENLENLGYVFEGFTYTNKGFEGVATLRVSDDQGKRMVMFSNGDDIVSAFLRLFGRLINEGGDFRDDRYFAKKKASGTK